MSDAPERRLRWLVRAGVILTALLILGTGTYFMQVWRARNLAARWAKAYSLAPQGAHRADPASWISQWNDAPWFRVWGCGTPALFDTHATRFVMYSFRERWVPRRAYYELLMRVTGQDLGNDPQAWKVWLEAHPNLVWNEKLQRLVEPK